MKILDFVFVSLFWVVVLGLLFIAVLKQFFDNKDARRTGDYVFLILALFYLGLMTYGIARDLVLNYLPSVS